MSSASGPQSRFPWPRLPLVNGHLPALSSVFASIIASSDGLWVLGAAHPAGAGPYARQNRRRTWHDPPRHWVLSGLAPASITCAHGRAATSRHAASRMASTVTLLRRWSSLRPACAGRRARDPTAVRHVQVIWL